MADVVDICNMALGHIGVTELVTDIEDTTPEAEQCALHLPTLRDGLLAEYAWPFATRRAVLAEVADVTRTDWDYVYALPDDCLSARTLVLPGVRNPPAEARYPFHVEAGEADGELVLLTDLEAAELIYTARREVAEKWPPHFVTALALRLASRLAPAFKKDARLGMALWQASDVEAQRGAALALNQRHPDAPPTPRALTARR